MSVCIPVQQHLAASAVALALRPTGGPPSWRTLPPLSNATDDDDSSSDPEHATDDASEPQASGDPNSPAEFITHKRKRGDDDESSFKEGKRLILHRASGHADDSHADDSDAESTPSDSLDSVDHDEHGSPPSSVGTDVTDDRDGGPTSPHPDEGDNSDIDYDSDTSSTKSLDSESVNYIQENGRAFHAECKDGYEYWRPNDEKQDEELDTYHACWLAFEGRLHSAPIGNVHNVLDIGAGTGIWAIDFAEKYPSASVIGIDISPTQPSWVPPNLCFQMDDCNLEPTFKRDSFDFIHVRGMAGCISDCDLFAKRQFQVLKPGGYLEYKDLSMFLQSDHENLENSSFTEWGNFWKKVGSNLSPNRSLTIAEDGTMKVALERAGFTNIKTIRKKMPVGDWSTDEQLKIAGKLHHAALTLDLEGLVLRPARILGWSYEEAICFAARVRLALQLLNLHLWRRVTVVYGQKPVKPE